MFAEGHTLIDVFAVVTVFIEQSPGGTDALEASRGVPALTSITHQVVDGTFVNISAGFPSGIDFVSGIADTAVGSNEVFTCAVIADIRILAAFIDIIPGVGKSIPMGTQLLELQTSLDWT